MTSPTADALRDSLARHALAAIPQILTLQDRTPVSSTYGCFDRAYWHYRIMDFPCGMSQEFVLPLALAWSLDLPGNLYRGQPQIRDWVEAGIRYAARSAHADGSCDDYYPFERAAGAAAFSLYACLEAAKIIGIEGDPEIDAFLKRRAHWLATHQESGQLSNHEALIVACLTRMSARFGSEWEAPLKARAARLLSWQTEEGWFSEYGGADPGYLSLTIGLMAETDRLRPDLGLREACGRAIAFFADFVHPDGSVGGEYTSRGTVNCFPFGFEIAADWSPLAASVNGLALRPLHGNRQPCYSDDHIIAHHVWAWMKCWAEWRSDRPAPLAPIADDLALDSAGLTIVRKGDSRLYCGLSRGGAFKLFDGERLAHSDTGPTLRTKKGKVAVTHLAGSSQWRREGDTLIVEGNMALAKSARLTPIKSIILRLIMLTIGRMAPDLIRRLLQALLVTGLKEAPFAFERRITPDASGWSITDTLTPSQGWDGIAAAGIGGFQTSTTTIMSRLWQPSQFQPWLELTDKIATLSGNAPLVVTRHVDITTA